MLPTPILVEAPQLIEQPPQTVFDIAHNGQVYLDILANRGRVNIDVNKLGTDTELLQIAGDAVIKASPNGHHQIGLVHSRVGSGRPMHAEHTKPQLVHPREPSQPHQGVSHWRCAQLSELAQLLRCSRQNDATAGIDHGALRRGDHLCSPPDLPGMPDDSWFIAAQIDLIRVGKVTLPHRDIFGNIDQHRARASRGGDIKSLLDGTGQVPHVPHQGVVLGARMRDANNIGFLKGIIANHRGWHLAGKHHDGSRIHERIGQSRNDVGPPRPRGDENDPRPAGHTGVALGHMHRPLLMASQDMPHPSTIEGIIERKNGATRMAKNRVHPFPT